MLSKITDMFKGMSMMKVGGILVAIALLVAAAVYVYMNYVKPRVEPNYVENSEFQKTSGSDAELYFFYTTWCPHCKRAKPEWESLVSEYENKTVNGVKVLFKGVDCDKEEDLANKFGVESYPTIKLVKDGQVIEYDAKPKKDTLVEFLEQAL